MFIIVRKSADGKLKVAHPEIVDPQDQALTVARNLAFKGEENDEIYVCEVQARVIPKLVVEP